MLNCYPWQQAQWQLMQQSVTARRLGSAYLLTGPEGIGLNQFARSLSASLFCKAHGDVGEACTECRACILLQAGNHPDLLWIAPEEEGKQIRVQQIRDLIGFISLKSQYEGYKIIIISPADAMNRSAANTLLKVLEEPPGPGLFLLLSHRPHGLPVTIRSRCQHVHFPPVYSPVAVDWLREHMDDNRDVEAELRIAHGAPLAALFRCENNVSDLQDEIVTDLTAMLSSRIDPVAIAEKWNRYGAARVCQWLLEYLHTMVQLKVGATLETLPHSQSQYSGLKQLLNRLDLHSLMQLYDLILKNYAMSISQVSYNKPGLLEDILIYWQDLVIHPGGEST